jgi:hypothetical protein
MHRYEEIIAYFEIATGLGIVAFGSVFLAWGWHLPTHRLILKDASARFSRRSLKCARGGSLAGSVWRVCAKSRTNARTCAPAHIDPTCLTVSRL